MMTEVVVHFINIIVQFNQRIFQVDKTWRKIDEVGIILKNLSY